MGNEPRFAQILTLPDATELLHRFAGGWPPTSPAAGRRGTPSWKKPRPAIPPLTDLRQASRSDTYWCAREVIASLRALGALRADLDPKAAADVLWQLIDSAQYRRLVTERRWSHRAFLHWQADAMTRLLLA